MPITEETKEYMRSMLAMPDGERFQLLQDMVVQSNLVVVIRLLMENGCLVESIEVMTQEAANQK